MNVVSLFTGIGAMDLAFEWAGYEIIAQVENDKFCNRILKKHWPHIPRWGDIRTVTGRDVRSITGTRTVDVLAGGFPCQDISVAGRGAGIQSGNRSGLWFEFARLIGDLRPHAVFIENVPGITRRGGTTVIGDLAALGYDAGWGMFRASDVGAPHKRERWFCVALPHTDDGGRPEQDLTSEPLRIIQRVAEAYQQQRWRLFYASATGSADELADTDDTGSHEQRRRATERDGKAGTSRPPREHLRGTVGRYSQLGNATGEGLPQRRQARQQAGQAQAGTGVEPESERSGELGQPTRERPQGGGATGQQVAPPQSGSTISGGAGAGGRQGDGQIEPRLGRDSDGITDWLDGCLWPSRPNEPQWFWEPDRTTTETIADRGARIKALGNAVVPQCVYPFAVALKEHLDG